MQKLFYILFILVNFWTIQAQQSPIFSQYPNHYELDNPAAIGNYEAIEEVNGFSFGLLSRLQWLGAGFDKTPVTGSFYGNFRSENKSILGFQFYQDRAGITNTTNLGFRYARKLGTKFILGAKFQHNRFWYQNKSSLFRADDVDNTFDQLEQNNASNSLASVGVFHFNEISSSGFQYFLGSSVRFKIAAPFETEQLYFRAGFQIKDIGFTFRCKNFFDAPAIFDGFLRYFLFNKRNSYVGLFYSTDLKSLKVGGVYWALDIPWKTKSYTISIGYNRTFADLFQSNSYDLGMKLRI